MGTSVKRGKASVQGIVGTVDLVVYAIQQSATVTHNYDAEIIQDETGFDCAWIARNQHVLSNFKFKVMDKSGTSTAAHAASLTFVAPWATVTLSGFDLADLNGTYQNQSGQSIDLHNTAVADFAATFKKYTDSTQNTLSQTTPS